MTRRGLAWLAGASSATPVKVVVASLKSTATPATKTVHHYPLALHAEIRECTDKSKIFAADMAEVTAAHIDPDAGVVSLKCSCGQGWLGSSIRLNKVQTHMASRSHLQAISAKTTSTNGIADVKAAAVRAEKEKVQRATATNIVDHARRVGIIMMSQRGQCQTTIENAFDLASYIATATLGGQPIPAVAINKMTQPRPGLSPEEKAVLEKLRGTMVSRGYTDAERASFESAVKKAAVTTSKQDEVNFNQGRSVMRKINAMGVSVQKNQTASPAIDTSRRLIRAKVVQFGGEIKKDILKFVKGAFATSGTGGEGQTPSGGEPFVFTLVAVHKGAFNRRTRVFDFGFEWTHHAVLIVDMNQDETGRSSCKVYTDWHKKELGEEQLHWPTRKKLSVTGLHATCKACGAAMILTLMSPMMTAALVVRRAVLRRQPPCSTMRAHRFCL